MGAAVGTAVVGGGCYALIAWPLSTDELVRAAAILVAVLALMTMLMRAIRFEIREYMRIEWERSRARHAVGSERGHDKTPDRAPPHGP